MDASGWRAVKQALDIVLEAPPEDRPRLIDELCGGDEGMRREIEDLLSFEEEAEEMPDAALGTLLSDDAEDPFVGTIIDSYHVREILAKGGMGAVYLAEKVGDFRQKVAIKIIKRGMDTDEVIARFRMERQILAGFKHPNIAAMLGGGSTESGLPYFIMELVEGQPLDEYCDSRRLDIGQRLALFLDICAAVSAAHRRLVVHRDLKPNNLLITEDGVPKLLDFGIAKLLQEDEDISLVRTLPERRIMTARYASPEQVRGEAITTASDVYSLGVILFQLLAGHLPYRLDTLSDETVVRHVEKEDPQRPSTVVALKEEISTGAGRSMTFDPEEVAENRSVDIKSLRSQLSGDLDAIVLKTLEKEPERRYASVDHLAEDIRRHLDGRPVEAVEPTWMYRTKRYIQRNTLAVAAGTTFVLGLIIFAVTVGILYLQAEAARKRANQEILMTQTVARTLAEVFEAAAPNNSRGKGMSWPGLLDQAEQGLRDLENDPQMYARFSRVLANTFIQNGEYGRAGRLADECISALETLFPDDKDVGYCKIIKASHLNNIRRNSEAEDLILQGINLLEKKGQEPNLAIAMAYQNLYRIRFDRGDLDASEGPLRRSIEIKEALFSESPRDALRRSLFSASVDRANLMLRRGRAEEARELLESEIPKMRDFFPPRNSILGAALDTMGRACFAKADYDSSAKALEEAVEISRHLSPEGSFLLARTLTSASKALLVTSRPQEALKFGLDGHKMMVDTAPTWKSYLGLGQTTLAEIYIELGDFENCLLSTQTARTYYFDLKVEPWRQAILDNIEAYCRIKTDRTAEGMSLMQDSVRALDQARAAQEIGLFAERDIERGYRRAQEVGGLSRRETGP